MIVIYIGRCRCTWPFFFPLWIESNRDTTFVWITFHLITFPMCSSRLISSYIYIYRVYTRRSTHHRSIDRLVCPLVVRVSRHKWRSLESGHWLSGRHPTWHSQTHSFIHSSIFLSSLWCNAEWKLLKEHGTRLVAITCDPHDRFGVVSSNAQPHTTQHTHSPTQTSSQEIRQRRWWWWWWWWKHWTRPFINILVFLVSLVYIRRLAPSINNRRQPEWILTMLSFASHTMTPYAFFSIKFAYSFSLILCVSVCKYVGG